MQFRSAFPLAVLLGGTIGAVAVGVGAPQAVVRIDPTQPRRSFFVSDAAAAASPVRWDLPAVSNASVERFVNLFTGSKSDEFALSLKRSGRYEGMIRRKLRERGMPEDLVYLSMIESGFNVTARSRAQAVGLWQFMAPTARGYGLRVDQYVDERKDPEKATDAALRYLRDLHQQFGAWYLAAAAYNTGDGRVSRALKAELGTSRGRESDFWRIRNRLPRETREYVPRMLAAATIGKEPHKYGMGDVERWMPVATEVVQVPAATPLAVVASAVGMEEKELARLNPHLVRRMTPPGKKPFPVRVPDGRAHRFARGFESARAAHEVVARATAAREAEATAAKRAGTRRAEARRVATRHVHRVRSGESLWTIARRHDTSVRAIQRANSMGKKSRLRPGQRLVIPG
jgi:membrane-bound lytic murein transglycosylase D